MKINSYRELLVWQRGMDIARETYRVSNQLPSDEAFGLSSQMKRAAVSIPSNIAEGYHRQGLGDFIKFLSIASGSLAELQTQILLTKEIFNSIKFDTIESLIDEEQKMLTIMIKRLVEKKRA